MDGVKFYQSIHSDHCQSLEYIGRSTLLIPVPLNCCLHFLALMGKAAAAKDDLIESTKPPWESVVVEGAERSALTYWELQALQTPTMYHLVFYSYAANLLVQVQLVPCTPPPLQLCPSLMLKSRAANFSPYCHNMSRTLNTYTKVGSSWASWLWHLPNFAKFWHWPWRCIVNWGQACVIWHTTRHSSFSVYSFSLGC